MTEHDLRELVRRIVAERLGGTGGAPGAHVVAEPVQVLDGRAHASHGLLRVPAGSESGGPCVIESHVACDHCGYCKSLGH